ncbi:hypothetical protein HYX11_00030 [Candidatus Woesearchaeota archaeon]|nr:hypothetical protein [Candidatus Woesearchaeota archaeon]
MNFLDDNKNKIKKGDMKMEKTTLHYVHPTGLVLSITVSIIYSICAFFVGFWPVQTIKFFKYWFRGLDLSRVFVIPEMSLGTFFLGLILVILFFYISGAL